MKLRLVTLGILLSSCFSTYSMNEYKMPNVDTLKERFEGISLPYESLINHIAEREITLSTLNENIKYYLGKEKFNTAHGYQGSLLIAAQIELCKAPYLELILQHLPEALDCMEKAGFYRPPGYSVDSLK